MEQIGEGKRKLVEAIVVANIHYTLGLEER